MLYFYLILDKALQLLEYLVKNGSQRVVDRAKDHVYDLKALKGFFYTDEKNKDQGINVRNRAKEILELLADDNKIRDERFISLILVKKLKKTSKSILVFLVQQVVMAVSQTNLQTITLQTITLRILLVIVIKIPLFLLLLKLPPLLLQQLSQKFK